LVLRNIKEGIIIAMKKILFYKDVDIAISCDIFIAEYRWVIKESLGIANIIDYAFAVI
jgi:hypothetical protein